MLVSPFFIYILEYIELDVGMFLVYAKSVALDVVYPAVFCLRETAGVLCLYAWS